MKKENINPYLELSSPIEKLQDMDALLMSLGILPDDSGDLHDFLNVKFPEIPSLVGSKLIVPCGLTLLGGGSKVGKSHLAIQLTLNRAVGESWLGFPTKPGRTLYINAEIMAPNFQRRFKDLLADRELPPRETVFIENVLGRNAYINTDKGRELIEGFIRRYGPDLVVLDPLTHLLLGDESNPVEVQKFLQVLAEWRLKYKTAILLIHHFRKNRTEGGRPLPRTIDDFSGSGLLGREPDAIIGLDGKPDGDKIELLFAIRHAEALPRFEIERGGNLWWRRTGKLLIPKILFPSLKLLVEGGLSRKDWRNAIKDRENCSSRVARRRIRDAIDKGFVTGDDSCFELSTEAREGLDGR